MKKRLLTAITVLLLVSLTGCGNNQNINSDLSMEESLIAEDAVSENEGTVESEETSEEEAVEEVLVEEDVEMDEVSGGYSLTIEDIENMDKSGMAAEEIMELYLECDPETVEYINLSNHHCYNTTRIIRATEQLPYLTKVDMCDCGVTDEQMDSLNKQFPNTRFVWMIRFGRWSTRTDALAFGTFQPEEIVVVMNNADAARLKYCTDLVALDIGHNRVNDISFLQYMPNLKILILVDNRPLSDLSWLEYCPKLEYLEFFVDSVSDLSVFEKLPNLVDLNIGYNPISDVTYLLNIPHLERLWIESTRLTLDDYHLLQETYPEATIVYYGSGSVDQGWRNHPRYWAMRNCLRNNVVDPLFMDDEEYEEYEAEQERLAEEAEQQRLAEEAAATAAAEAEENASEEVVNEEPLAIEE